jgi:hypothetical protein
MTLRSDLARLERLKPPRPPLCPECGREQRDRSKPVCIVPFERAGFKPAPPGWEVIVIFEMLEWAGDPPGLDAGELAERNRIKAAVEREGASRCPGCGRKTIAIVSDEDRARLLEPQEKARAADRVINPLDGAVETVRRHPPPISRPLADGQPLGGDPPHDFLPLAK